MAKDKNTKKEIIKLVKSKWTVKKEPGLFPSVIMGTHKNNTCYTHPSFCVNETPSAESGTFEIAAELICNAINNTYGKGLNPDGMEDILSALIDCVERVEMDMGPTNPRVLKAKEAIKKATEY